jgi:hypothetical protein
MANVTPPILSRGCVYVGVEGEAAEALMRAGCGNYPTGKPVNADRNVTLIGSPRFRQVIDSGCRSCSDPHADHGDSAPIHKNSRFVAKVIAGWP